MKKKVLLEKSIASEGRFLNNGMEAGVSDIRLCVVALMASCRANPDEIENEKNINK